MTNDMKIDTKHWNDITGLMRLIDAIYSMENPARIVGGAVRDTVSGTTFSDVDIATPLRPNIVMDKLDAIGIRTIPTGIQHGTITAVSNGNSFEITTLRKDIDTDGRHATVKFSDDWREDAMRRDFTINALYADPKTGELFDYFEGLSDLKKKCVRFIGDPMDRIKEDHLRILRYFRFLARFENAHVHSESIAACHALSSHQMTLARERINDELMKTLAAQNPYDAVKLAFENDIFTSFLPEINHDSVASLEQLIAREQQYDIAPFALRRFAALIKPADQYADKIASRLKFSNAMRKSLLKRLSEHHIDPQDYRHVAFKFGKDIAIDQILLHSHNIDIGHGIADLKNWDIPSFTISGGELIKRGLPAGPIVSTALQQIKNDWIQAGFPSQDGLEDIVSTTIKRYS